MAKHKIIKADDFDLAIDETGHAKITDTRWESSFGKRHGGKSQVVLLVSLAKCVGLALLLGLAIGLGNSQMSTDAKSIIIIVSLSTVVLFDFGVIFLYYRLRYALLILGALLGLLACAVGMMMLVELTLLGSVL